MYGFELLDPGPMVMCFQVTFQGRFVRNGHLLVVLCYFTDKTVSHELGGKFG
jgi:hypothetical protein